MARQMKTTDGRTIADPRQTEAWKQLALRVRKQEPICWLKLPGCTTVSTTGDHVIPVVDRPDLALVRANVRGACYACNRRRGSTPIESMRLDAGQPTETPTALSVFD